MLERQVYGRPLVYLDNAATAQKPRAVISAMDDVWLESNANVHRAEHAMAEEVTVRYESARETVARFIGAANVGEVIFTSGATMSLNVAAWGLCRSIVDEGDNIIVSEMEHHSNIVPWQLACGAVEGARVGTRRRAEIRVLPFTDGGYFDVGVLEELIDDRTKVLAITQCSNVLGVRFDLRPIIEAAHRHGVIVVVDGCQGAVHGGVNVAELGCDMYAFSGHKLYGPTGIGVLWGRRELLERMPPLLGGGDMVAPGGVSIVGGTRFAELPFRFEAGTANYVGAIGLAAAVEYIEQFEVGEIERHEARLLAAAVRELRSIEGLRIYGAFCDDVVGGYGAVETGVMGGCGVVGDSVDDVMDDCGRRIVGRAPIVSFTIEGVHPADVGAIVDKQGVAIRTGTHCAQPLVERYGAGSMCRASFGLYNTEEEAVALTEAVRRAVKMLRR